MLQSHSEVMKMKALIAMSGGVDSAVSALLMQRAGYDCVGATMKLFPKEETAGQVCGSGEDCRDARQVALRLGMPHHVFEFYEQFRCQVMERFVSTYEAGATPNPCIDCNRHLKFGQLFELAKQLGCDVIATGHYARIEEKDGRFLLKKGLDASKDQSYVLYSLTQEQLSHVRFPLGGLTKQQSRKIAEENGFLNARKADSQDICFIPDGDYPGFITRFTGKTYPAGDFVDTAGRVLGRHRGLIHYTVGQRRGLGISAPQPLYVKALDVPNNRVILGTNAELFQRTAVAGSFNWIAFPAPASPIRCRARARYHHPEQPATVTVQRDGTVRIVFDEPQRALTPGQAMVLYDDDVVLGGGTILLAE